jgi:hypothetical protein
VRPLELQPATGFTLPDGTVRELRNPGAAATLRQLARLNHAGMLCVVEPGSAGLVTVGMAAAAIDYAAREAAA